MNYLEARYYNSSLGHFLSQDPVFWELGQTKRATTLLADPQQLNSYSYARNNPIILSDPTGEIVDTAWDVAMIAWDVTSGTNNAIKFLQGIVGGIIGSLSGNGRVAGVGFSQAKEAGIDFAWDAASLTIDAAALMLPLVPAGELRAAKIARDSVRESEIGADIAKLEQKLSTGELKSGSAGGATAGKGFPQSIKNEAYSEAEGKCMYCGVDTHQNKITTPTKSETDHVVPRARGGDATITNAQNLCRTCNRQKGAKTPQEFFDSKK